LYENTIKRNRHTSHGLIYSKLLGIEYVGSTCCREQKFSWHQPLKRIMREVMDGVLVRQKLQNGGEWGFGAENK